MNLEKSPLSKLVLGLCLQTQTDPTEPQDSNTIRENKKIITQNYKTIECYLALNREYTLAEYLTTVTDPK
jgi:hypothetical protein